MGRRIKSGNDEGERAAARVFGRPGLLLITIRRANDCFFCCLRHTARQYLEVALEYCHEGHYCRRGRRRPGDGADAARARDRLRGFRAGGRDPRARRRHQHVAHAIKELAELGLLDRLDAVAIRTYELFYTNRLGQEIWREPRGLDAGYDIPQFSIHRGRLQGVIYQAVRARLGESRIHLNCRLQSFTQDDGGVTAYFFDRHGSHRHTARGDVLIGADGIHSLVRDKLFPDEGPPRWNGLMLWRGAIDWPAFLTGRSMVVAGGSPRSSSSTRSPRVRAPTKG